MKFAMIGKEKRDLLIQGTAYINRGDHINRFDCMYNVINIFVYELIQCNLSVV